MTEPAGDALRAEFPGSFGDWTYDVSISDGWLPLVRNLTRYLEAMASDEGQQPPHVLQVKDKFGGLRFYVDNPTVAQGRVIQFAEMLSFSICERCGTMADVTVEGGWRKALCARCRQVALENGL